MIRSFGDKATEDLAAGSNTARARRVPPEIRRSALRKVQLIHRARDLKDLRAAPGNCLESLSGNLAGRHGIRINQQWRVVFRWEGGNVFDVRITDYH